MLRLVEIHLELPEKVYLHSSMGSVMHGALMEIVGKETADVLHQISLRPYSQCVYFDRKRQLPVWRIGTLNDTAYERIVLPLLEFDHIYLKQKRYSVSLTESSVLQAVSYEELADELFKAKKYPNGVDIAFLTTASFKHNGAYEVFPESNRIFNSLLNRWNAFSPDISLIQDDLENELAKACMLTKYELRTRPYSLEGREIYGFSGSMRLRFTGNEMTNRLMGLLFSFAPFAGIGIKTALGMGAIHTAVHYRRD